MLSYQFHTSERERHPKHCIPLYQYRRISLSQGKAARIALNAIGEEMAHGYEGEVIVCCFSEKDAESISKALVLLRKSHGSFLYPECN